MGSSCLAGDECGMVTREAEEYCREKGIHVTVLSALGANGASWDSLAVMESPLVKEIAAAKGKTVAQVALTWIYERVDLHCEELQQGKNERKPANFEIGTYPGGFGEVEFANSTEKRICGRV